jgi:hypothetical protein
MNANFTQAIFKLADKPVDQSKAIEFFTGATRVASQACRRVDSPNPQSSYELTQLELRRRK